MDPPTTVTSNWKGSSNCVVSVTFELHKILNIEDIGTHRMYNYS